VKWNTAKALHIGIDFSKAMGRGGADSQRAITVLGT